MAESGFTPERWVRGGAYASVRGSASSVVRPSFLVAVADLVAGMSREEKSTPSGPAVGLEPGERVALDRPPTGSPGAREPVDTLRCRAGGRVELAQDLAT